MDWQHSVRFPWMRQQQIRLAITQLVRGFQQNHLHCADSGHWRQRQAGWLVNQLVELGPTFIKLGQALSTRVDLLPLEYIHALQSLPGWMPPMKTATAIACIEAELGASAGLLYRSFDPAPISADCLGQVHRATLRQGKPVVVKIQRPEVEPLLHLDLAILRQLIPGMQSRFQGKLPCNLEDLFEDLAHRLSQRINSIQTGLNADRLRHNFRDTPVVWIPQIYPSYTTQRILTMEYAPGITITDYLRLDRGGFDRSLLQPLTVYCYLKQVLQDGFFQINLTPNRLAVSQDSRLILYGFSDVAELSPLQRSQLIRALFELQQQDGGAALSNLINGGWLKPDIAPVLMRQIMQVILRYFHQGQPAQETFKQVQAEIYQLFQQRPFCLANHTLWMLQGLASLDQISQALDPATNLLQISQPLMACQPTAQGLIQRINTLKNIITT